MVLGHLLLVQVFKVQTRNMTLLLELTFQVCCRLQQNRMDCRFQTIMTQMWLCSQHGSHHLVVNWRCHGKAVFGTSFGPERFCPGDDDTWYQEASSFSCRTTESWSTGWYCRAKGDGQTDCWGQKLFATYQKCSGENLARRTWSDMGDIHTQMDFSVGSVGGSGGSFDSCNSKQGVICGEGSDNGLRFLQQSSSDTHEESQQSCKTLSHSSWTRSTFSLQWRTVLHVPEGWILQESDGLEIESLFVESLVFCRHVLGVESLQQVICSRRCLGASSNAALSCPRQAEPFSVPQLRRFHEVLRNGPELWDQVMSGMVLFCVYGRSRWSDSQHAENMLSDFDNQGNLQFLEIQASVHKTARAFHLRHMFLPVAAPATGVTDDCWGRQWMQAREMLRISDLSLYPWMPAPDSSLEPTRRSISTLVAKRWIHHLLGPELVKPGAKLTSHSCKCTVWVSWQNVEWTSKTV